MIGSAFLLLTASWLTAAVSRAVTSRATYAFARGNVTSDV